MSYRSRGLDDALQLARQALAIIEPEAITTDSTYGSLRELWLSFGEQEGVHLTEEQEHLLNTLVLTYLEGQSGQGVNEMSRRESPVLSTDNNKEDDVPLWQQYKDARLQADALLKGL